MEWGEIQHGGGASNHMVEWLCIHHIFGYFGGVYLYCFRRFTTERWILSGREQSWQRVERLFVTCACFCSFCECVFFFVLFCFAFCIFSPRRTFARLAVCADLHLSPPGRPSAFLRSRRCANNHIDVTFYTVRNNKRATRERLFHSFPSSFFFACVSELKRVGRSGVDLVNGNKRWHQWLQMFDKTEQQKTKTKQLWSQRSCQWSCWGETECYGKWK